MGAFDHLPYRPCVGILLTDGRGRLFAGARAHGASGAWQAPQGGVDPGETHLGAALRELVEETGVAEADVTVLAQSETMHRYDLPDEIIPTRWGGRYRGQEQAWFLLRLDAGDDAIDIGTPEPEFTEWRWMTPDEMLDAIVAFKRPVYRDVIDEFRPHLAAAD